MIYIAFKKLITQFDAFIL